MTDSDSIMSYELYWLILRINKTIESYEAE